MNAKWTAFFDLALAMIIVGSSVVFGKIIVKSFPVFLASGLRFALASLIMVPMVIKMEGGLPPFGKKDWLILGIMAFCGQFMFTVFLLWGLKLTSAIEAGLITSTTPAAMTAVSFLILRERLTVRQISGVFLAVLGVIAVNGLLAPAGQRPDPGHLWGNLLVCGAVLGEAFFLLLRKAIKSDVSSLTTAGTLCFFGLVMFLPAGLYQARDFDFTQVGLEAWGAIVYFGAIFTVVAYILWFRGVTRVSGSTAGVVTAVMPISAVVLSFVFLGEPFTWSHALGGVLVLMAIFIMTLKPKPGPVPATPGNLPVTD